MADKTVVAVLLRKTNVAGNCSSGQLSILMIKKMKKGFPSLLFQSVARVGMDLPFFVKICSFFFLLSFFFRLQLSILKPRYRPKCPPHGRKDEEKGGVRSTLPCDKSLERKMAVFFFFHHVYFACSSKRPVFFGYEPAFRAETPQVEIPKFVNTLKYVNTLKVAVLGPRGKPPFLPT